jgi:hypothetical protein
MPQDRTETPLRTPAHHFSSHTPLPHFSPDSDALIYGTSILQSKVAAGIQKFMLEFEVARLVD